MDRFETPESGTVVLSLCLFAATWGLSLAGCSRQEPQEDAANTRLWSFDFERDAAPADFSAVSGRWRIVTDATAPSPPGVYAQTAGHGRFQVSHLAQGVYSDFAASVSFKTISGVEDRAGGLVFRYQDDNHYYILRANATEDNLILFRYADGMRKEVVSRALTVTHNEWHSLKVVCAGSRIIAYFDGERQFEATDGQYKEGSIGLWTKADSVTYFDDLKIAPLRSL